MNDKIPENEQQNNNLNQIKASLNSEVYLDSDEKSTFEKNQYYSPEIGKRSANKTTIKSNSRLSLINYTHNYSSQSNLYNNFKYSVIHTGQFSSNKLYQPQNEKIMINPNNVLTCRNSINQTIFQKQSQKISEFLNNEKNIIKEEQQQQDHQIGFFHNKKKRGTFIAKGIGGPSSPTKSHSPLKKQTNFDEANDVEIIINILQVPLQFRKVREMAILRIYLKKFDYFKKLIQQKGQQFFQELTNIINYKFIRRKTVIFQQGEKQFSDMKGFYIIIKGNVKAKIHKFSSGALDNSKKDVKLIQEVELTEGQVIGDFLLIENEQRQQEVKKYQCNIDTVFAYVDKKILEDLIQQLAKQEHRQTLNYFRNLCLFQDLQDKEIDQFINHFKKMSTVKDQIIYTEGDDVQYIYIILSGEFLLYYNQTNLNNLTTKQFNSNQQQENDVNNVKNDFFVSQTYQKQSHSLFPHERLYQKSIKRIAIMNPDEIFGIEEVISNNTSRIYSVSCVTIEGSLYYIHKEIFLKLAKQMPSIQTKYQQYINNKIKWRNQQVQLITDVESTIKQGLQQLQNNKQNGNVTMNNSSDDFNQKMFKSSQMFLENQSLFKRRMLKLQNEADERSEKIDKLRSYINKLYIDKLNQYDRKKRLKRENEAKQKSYKKLNNKKKEDLQFILTPIEKTQLPQGLLDSNRLITNVTTRPINDSTISKFKQSNSLHKLLGGSYSTTNRKLQQQNNQQSNNDLNISYNSNNERDSKFLNTSITPKNEINSELSYYFGKFQNNTKHIKEQNNYSLKSQTNNKFITNKFMYQSNYVLEKQTSQKPQIQNKYYKPTFSKAYSTHSTENNYENLSFQQQSYFTGFQRMLQQCSQKMLLQPLSCSQSKLIINRKQTVTNPCIKIPSQDYQPKKNTPLIHL